MPLEQYNYLRELVEASNDAVAAAEGAGGMDEWKEGRALKRAVSAVERGQSFKRNGEIR